MEREMRLSYILDSSFPFHLFRVSKSEYPGWLSSIYLQYTNVMFHGWSELLAVDIRNRSLKVLN